METDNLIEAKRLIVMTSPEGARILGAGVYRPCSQERYNAAAQAALADPDASLSPEQRQLIASCIEPEDTRMAYTLRVRLSASEYARLQALAGADGMDVSHYVRTRIFTIEKGERTMHPITTGPEYRDDDGNPARLIRCPDCGQMEWWTEDECRDHGHCRASSAPCEVCETPSPSH